MKLDKLGTSSSYQLIKFLIMGGLAALVHFLVLYSAVSFFAITPIWANVIAFLIAFVVSFIGHLNVTFKTLNDQSGPNSEPSTIMPRLLKWFASSVAGFAINQSLFVLGISWLGDQYYLIVWFIVTAIVTVLSFLLGKLWAFK
ncbi:MAG: GtrA family protein [Psychrobacter sp.]|nr:GtrA family protein [Psychrobacter sp.]